MRRVRTPQDPSQKHLTVAATGQVRVAPYTPEGGRRRELMRLRESLQMLRRWRSVIVAGIVIGAVVGLVSGPGTIRGTPFEATRTLLVDSKAVAGPELRRAPILVIQGPVPARVADRLGAERRLVQSNVFAYFQSNGRVLVIIGRGPNPTEAEALANVTAEELIVEMGGPAAPLKTLEPAVASPRKGDNIQGPTSRASRAVLLGAFGLLLGVGAAYALERFDRRVRSKGAAEDALGVRVMAEVPPMSHSEREQLLTGSSPVLEAYRGLRTIVDRWALETDREQARVIVVTSPLGGEGKTVTVAHLAATFGEIGRSVVAVSADLRDPRLHFYFDKAREPGLTDVLRGAPDVRRLTDLNLVTKVRGVRLVASGTPVRNSAPLLDRIGDHLRDARDMADLVLIDAPSLLPASDGADVARQADSVVLVVRAGRTSVSAARRSVELLERLGIPVLGAVLIGSDRPAART